MSHAPQPPSRPLRIMVGTFEISGLVADLADGFEKLGHAVTSAMCVGASNFADLEYHLDVGDDVKAVDWRALSRDLLDPSVRPPRALSPRASPAKRLRWLIHHHDVFVFVFASLWHDRTDKLGALGIGREFPLLKRLGKRVVSYFVGPDARHASSFDQEMAQLGMPEAAIRDIKDTWKSTPLLRQLRNVRRAERYADVIFSQPNQASLALRPYHHLDVPVQLDALSPRVPGRQTPVVVHAPSEKSIKGTKHILAALDRLRADGVRFELKLLHDVPNREVLAALGDADVVIDQLHLPMHGKLGVEAMGSGCALATCDRKDFEPHPANRPIWHIDVTNVTDALHRLLTDRELRVSLANDGLKYVRERHGHVPVCANILDRLTRPDVRPEHWPTFFARHYRLPRGERIAQEFLAMSDAVVRRHGLPDGVNVREMVRRGLLSPAMARHDADIPRWSEARA